MKQLKFLSILYLAVFFTACKEKEPIDNDPVNNDYRKEYLGNYKCIRTGNGNDTTLVISVSKVKDSMISILDFVAIVDQNGHFYYNGINYYGYLGFGGNFYKDSISFMTCKGGLGSYWCYNYNGKKL